MQRKIFLALVSVITLGLSHNALIAYQLHCSGPQSGSLFVGEWRVQGRRLPFIDERQILRSKPHDQLLAFGPAAGVMSMRSRVSTHRLMRHCSSTFA